MASGPADTETTGVWHRLHQRKVVQWGLAYVAGAWGLLQGLAYLSATFHWPEQFQRLATIGLIVGLPVALVLAWYHGDRGHQRVTRSELAILVLLVLAGGGCLWRYEQATQRADGDPTPGDPVAASATTIVRDRSIAVLPFVNMSSDKEQEYFSDGLSEELLNLLAQVPELRVIARTSSFSFKGRPVDIATIARQLDVASVLEGSVRRSGDRIRITAQLIRTSDSSHLWSQTYDRQLSDIFQIQDEIAAAVVDQLKIKLLGVAPKSRTADPRAYALYLQAREVSRQVTNPAFEQSIALYQQALAVDPSYAVAWADLANVYINEVMNSLRPADEGIGLARAAIDQALAADPDCARAYAARGWAALLYDRDLVAAAKAIERALALAPTDPDILNTAAILARRLTRLDLAIAIGEHQVARDPLNTDARSDLGVAYRYAGRLDDAVAEFRDVLRLRPGFAYGHHTIGGILLQQGDAKAALAEFQLEPEERVRLSGTALAYHALGQRTAADAALARLTESYEKTAAYEIASVLAFRGDSDAAFDWLDKAARNHDPGLGAVSMYPMLANLHSDARWLPFLREHGIAPEQLAAITFDVAPPT